MRKVTSMIPLLFFIVMILILCVNTYVPKKETIYGTWVLEDECDGLANLGKINISSDGSCSVENSSYYRGGSQIEDNHLIIRSTWYPGCGFEYVPPILSSEYRLESGVLVLINPTVEGCKLEGEFSYLKEEKKSWWS